MPGVSLNTKVKAGREYIYRFLAGFENTPQESQAYQSWRTAMADAIAEIQAYDQWVDSGSVGAAPSYSGIPGSPRNGVTLQATNIDYRVSLDWKSITERTGSGLAKPDAKVGDLWWDDRGKDNWTYEVKNWSINRITIDDEDTFVSLYWQDGPDSWRALDIRGLVHRNLVYKDKFVETNAAEALQDEELSGLIIPLKQSVLSSMSLKDVTELSPSSLLIQINVVVIKKIKWYQRGFFKFIAVVAIIATIAFTGGFSGKSYRDWETDRKSTRLNSSHSAKSRMPSSA